MNDSFDLQRFLIAQDDTYDDAVAELAAGNKRTHWMWFIFPQVTGLGFSYNSEFYSIHSSAEARAYLDHPVLGARLRQCAELLLATQGLSASEILGSPDDLKLCSSMTLFAKFAAPDNVFEKVLEKFYGGVADHATTVVVAKWRS